MLPLQMKAVLRCWDLQNLLLPLDRSVPTGACCAGIHLLTPVIMAQEVLLLPIHWKKLNPLKSFLSESWQDPGGCRERRIGVVPKSPAVRTTELLGSPGPPPCAFFFSFFLQKSSVFNSLFVCGVGMVQIPIPQLLGLVLCRSRRSCCARGLLVVVPVAGQVQSTQMCTQHICCSHPMSGKVLGLCWSRITFFQASKAKQKAWVAVSAMWTDWLKWPSFNWRGAFRWNVESSHPPREHISSKFYVALGSQRFINKAFPDV